MSFSLDHPLTKNEILLNSCIYLYIVVPIKKRRGLTVYSLLDYDNMKRKHWNLAFCIWFLVTGWLIKWKLTIFCRSVNAFTPWKYQCGPENYCIKLPSLVDLNGISLTECKLTCGENLQLWPLPTGKTELGKVKKQYLVWISNMYY